MRALRVVGVLLTVGMLAGCSGQPPDDGESIGTAQAGGAQPGNEQLSREQGDSATGSDRSTGNGSTKQGTNIVGTQRKLARTARMEISARDVPRATNSARTIVSRAEGFVGAESTDDGTANLTLKVPSDRLDTTLGELAGLGRVSRKQVRAEDVTEQVVDVRTRLASQRASVQRVREMLERASSVSEMVSVESELASREAELESLQARQEELSDRAALSTVRLRLSTQPAPAAGERAGFLGGLAGGWHALLDVGGAVLTGLGVVLPFAIALAVPALPAGWMLARRRRTRAVPESS